jgi:ppGpp synthetase/RelA/SpoT-type nucleotidyltranferase
MNFDEYKYEKLPIYTAFAATVTSILKAAIEAEGGYRLQQIQNRAKEPSSLLKKLEQRKILSTNYLENDIKDLAGCRVVFYTNNDVNKFIRSRIINQNFDVIDNKTHQPGRVIEDATELYNSNHYIVRLSSSRILLPEYSRFSDLKCEIQIHTILNHAWAEMAHDTIYKHPVLENFGAKIHESINKRLQKVAQEYLLPAGYEFQKIVSDFQRILVGKKLFDRNILRVIIDAADNNIRVQALETFAKNVLPLYDDLQGIYPDVIISLIEAAKHARSANPIIIETPYGNLPAKTYNDVVKIIIDILVCYRYCIDIKETFDALCLLYSWSMNDEEREPLLNLGKKLAHYDLEVWRLYGPFIQEELLNHIESINGVEILELQPLLLIIFNELLGTEVRSTSRNSTTLVFHRGVVVASKRLRLVRKRTIDFLRILFFQTNSDESHFEVMRVFKKTIYPPLNQSCSDELLLLLMQNMITTFEFMEEIASKLNFELLQDIENQVHRCFWTYAHHPNAMHDSPKINETSINLKSSILAFRNIINSNPDYVIFKILIGFNSIFLPAWEDKEFGIEKSEKYRIKKLNELILSVNEDSSEIWFNRIKNYAEIKSNDSATFMIFRKFLVQLALAQPAITLSYVDRLNASLIPFLPSFLDGLMQSIKYAEIMSQIDTWLQAGINLPQIAWYVCFAEKFNEVLIYRTNDTALKYNNLNAVNYTLIAMVKNFDEFSDNQVKIKFFLSLQYLHEAKNFSWVQLTGIFLEKSTMIHSFDEMQINFLLDLLIFYPKFNYDLMRIITAIAKQWLDKVINFIGDRIIFSRTENAPRHYESVPFDIFDSLQKLLVTASVTLFENARIWFEKDPKYFNYDCSRFIYLIFPEFTTDIEEYLMSLIKASNVQDYSFVLSILSAYEGKSFIFKFVREIIVYIKPENPLWDESAEVLITTGVVSGMYGHAEIYAQRKVLLESWVVDENKNVQDFAKYLINKLDSMIANENRSAEATIALRKLSYDE